MDDKDSLEIIFFDFLIHTYLNIFFPSASDPSNVQVYLKIERIDKMGSVQRETYHGWVIRRSMKDYRECTDVRNWVTIQTAYFLYCMELSEIDSRAIFDFDEDMSNNVDPLEPICRQAFGAELRHAFPSAVPVSRWIKGRQTRGLAGIIGPGSRRSKKIG